MRNRKKAVIIFLCTWILVVTLGCDISTDWTAVVQETTKTESEVKSTLTVATWDSEMIALFNSLDINSRFQKTHPNILIEVEQSKDDLKYWEDMKIRAAANQLPDIMINKPFTISRFQEYLCDLSNTNAAQNNTLAQAYAQGEEVLGIPEKSVGDYVYYWSDMFAEAGVSVPQTWEEFVNVCKTLQAYFVTDNINYSALSIGAKDEWPTYPFMEYMPSLISGNNNIWDEMTHIDRPFEKGTDIVTAYHKADELFNAGVCGKDPLNIGHDQAVARFSGRQASLIVAGPWCLSAIEDGDVDTSQLKTFYLPVRDDASDPLRIIVQGDNMMGVINYSEVLPEAMDFVEFYFSGEWYPDYIGNIGDDSTMEKYPKPKDPILAYADNVKTQKLLYQAGGTRFEKIQKKAKFNYKKLGSQMFVDGFDLDAEFESLNGRWAQATAEIKY